MPDTDTIATTFFTAQPNVDCRPTRPLFVLLQTLVTIVLSYQVLFSREIGFPTV